MSALWIAGIGNLIYGYISMYRSGMQLRDLYRGKSTRFSFVTKEPKSMLPYFGTGVAYVKFYGVNKPEDTLLGERAILDVDLPEVTKFQYCGTYPRVNYLNFESEYMKFAKGHEIISPIKLQYEVDEKIRFILDTETNRAFCYIPKFRARACRTAVLSARWPLSITSTIIGAMILWYVVYEKYFYTAYLPEYESPEQIPKGQVHRL